MKNCLICLSESDSACATCPLCGEASWGEAAPPLEAPAEPPAVDAEPAVDEAPVSKKGGKKK